MLNKTREEILYDLIVAFASNSNVDPEDVVDTAERVADTVMSLAANEVKELDVDGLKNGLN